MPENLGKITAKNAKRSPAVDAGRSKRPLRKLNSKLDSVRPCANESGSVCKHTNVCVHTRTIVSGLFRKQAHNEKAGKKTFSCAKSIKRKSLHRNTNLDAPVRG